MVTQFNSKTPVEVLKLFRVILKDAAKTFNKSPAKVTNREFSVCSNGRLGEQSMLRCGGFVALRNYASTGKTPPGFNFLKGKK